MDQDTEADIRRIVNDELRKAGIDPDDATELREVLRWTAKHRQSFENVGGWIGRSIVLVVVGAIFLAIWEGMKHYLRGGGQ